MTKRFLILAAVIVGLVFNPGRTSAQSQLLVLDADNWRDTVPRGKEVDAILGDIVLRNERIVMVVGRPVRGRNANMTVRNVGGAIIDLTNRKYMNDQLSAFFPLAARYAFSEDSLKANVDGRDTDMAPLVEGGVVSLMMQAPAGNGRPQVDLTYRLSGNRAFVEVITELTNTLDRPLEVELSDAIRADRTFQTGNDSATGLYWVYDEWFGQAYGILAEGYELKAGESRGSLMLQKDGNSKATLQAGEKLTIQRKVFPGGDLLAVKSTNMWQHKTPGARVNLVVRDPAGPVKKARVILMQGKDRYGWGRTTGQGTMTRRLPLGTWNCRVEALGRPPLEVPLDVREDSDFTIDLQPCGYVSGKFVDEDGQPIPCKVSFTGQDDTENPYFGPDSQTSTMQNVVYTHDGTFKTEIGPGSYEVTISRGPEYDAIVESVEVVAGKVAEVRGALQRVVDSSGWVSSDFHSHSSPSGDNTGSQRGRVLNLICEHVEFAPCTEHNRIDSYAPHIRALEVGHLLASCTGIELTGSPLPVNHQNAFPLTWVPRTQDGGAPVTSSNPVEQIKRLAGWNDGRKKLVQMNHPNLQQIYGDRDTDGKADEGFREMLSHLDVIEVHPPEDILKAPGSGPSQRNDRQAMFRWLQLLNVGYRAPGVVNTDAHYNFHGSGWLRNYIASTTDDPSEIKTAEMVRESEAGHVIMSTGPFMRVAMQSGQGEHPRGIPGDDVTAPNGKATLRVDVQCANWLDVNRVQVFFNGRAVPELDFTRRENKKYFSEGVMKFEAEIPLEMKGDTHVIVVAAGEGQKLGNVMGPQGGQRMPIAVSNPIFVDVDGGGFQANGDLLDEPLLGDPADE